MNSGNKIVYVKSIGGPELKTDGLVPGDSIVHYRWENRVYSAVYAGLKVDDMEADPNGLLFLVPPSENEPAAIKGTAQNICGSLYRFELADDVECFDVIGSLVQENTRIVKETHKKLFIDMLDSGKL